MAEPADGTPDHGTPDHGTPDHGTPDHGARAAAGVAALQRWYRPRAGRWRTAGWWNAANALTAVIGYTRLTGDQGYADVVDRTFRAAPRWHPGFVNRLYDDTGWWGLAWVDAFDLTGDPRYLAAARGTFARMTAGWDDACGGGLWWSTARRYKNAITNELFLTLAARLHQRVAAADGPPGGYLDWARREWDWFAARGLIGPAGLVNDGLTAECVNNGGLTWTYNQGVILGGLAALHEITGDRGYLDQGAAIADAAIGQLGRPAAPGGPAILTEPCETATRTRDRDRPQFKGVFVRYLAEFSARHGRPDYREFILANARSAWERSRTDRDEFGLSWAGPFDRADAVRQSAALDLLNAAVAVTRV